MTASESIQPLNTELVRKQFPGLQAGSVCLNNGSGALVFQGAIESIARTMSKPHMNLRGLDSKSKVDVEERRTNYARLASFMNANPDEIGKWPPTGDDQQPLPNELLCSIRTLHNRHLANADQLIAPKSQRGLGDDCVGALPRGGHDFLGCFGQRLGYLNQMVDACRGNWHESRSKADA